MCARLSVVSPKLNLRQRPNTQRSTLSLCLVECRRQACFVVVRERRDIGARRLHLQVTEKILPVRKIQNGLHSPVQLFEIYPNPMRIFLRIRCHH